MKRSFSILIIAALTLLICSCNRRELEVMDPQKAQITLKVDWPKGCRVIYTIRINMNTRPRLISGRVFLFVSVRL